MTEQNFDLPGYIQVLDETQQEVNEDFEKLERKAKIIECSRLYIKTSQAEMLDLYNKNNKLLEDMVKLQKDNEALLQKLTEEKNQRIELEMKLAEMTKLSAGIAKKASEEAVRNALRTYANTSKRKTVDKRAFAKTAILEMANVNGVDLPEDLKATIESLDDERPEPRVVTVESGGHYNDIHDNETVRVNGKG